MMYRLTITQSDPNEPYIVVDCTTLDECSEYLKRYKNSEQIEFFINYDIIEVHEILVDSYELDNIDFSDLEKEHAD